MKQKQFTREPASSSQIFAFLHALVFWGSGFHLTSFPCVWLVAEQTPARPGTCFPVSSESSTAQKAVLCVHLQQPLLMQIWRQALTLDTESRVPNMRWPMRWPMALDRPISWFISTCFCFLASPHVAIPGLLPHKYLLPCRWPHPGTGREHPEWAV